MQPSMQAANQDSPAPSHVFLTEQQLAARHQVSVKKVQADRLRGAGVPFVRVGRLVRYRLSDIMAYEDAHLRRSTSERGA